MRFGKPMVLGLTTLFNGLTFTFGHYQHDTLVPFDVLDFAAVPHSWLTAQHWWGLLFLVVGLGILVPTHIYARAAAYVAGALVWGGFGVVMAAEATFLDPHHQTGAVTGITFLGMAALFIYANKHRLWEDWIADRRACRRWQLSWRELRAGKSPKSLSGSL